MSLFTTKRFICDGYAYTSLFGAIYRTLETPTESLTILDKLSGRQLDPASSYLLYDASLGLYWVGRSSWTPIEDEAKRASLPMIAEVLDDTLQDYAIVPVPERFTRAGTRFNSLFGAIYIGGCVLDTNPRIWDAASKLVLSPHGRYLLLDPLRDLYWAGSRWTPHRDKALHASLPMIAAKLDARGSEHLIILPLTDEETPHD